MEQSPVCPLHAGYRLSVEYLQGHRVKIFNEEDDLVPERDRSVVDSDSQAPWEELSISLVCEDCYKQGHFAYTESLETHLRGELLVSSNRNFSSTSLTKLRVIEFSFLAVNVNGLYCSGTISHRMGLWHI